MTSLLLGVAKNLKKFCGKKLNKQIGKSKVLFTCICFISGLNTFEMKRFFLMEKKYFATILLGTNNSGLI